MELREYEAVISSTRMQSSECVLVLVRYVEMIVRNRIRKKFSYLDQVGYIHMSMCFANSDEHNRMGPSAKVL